MGVRRKKEGQPTDGLGPLTKQALSRGTWHRLRLEFSRAQGKAVPTLGICPQCFLASGFCACSG